eukprot:TRINITY_DN2296_c1_g6_i1.p1 TRINITY_DN2296_c1_g6~~TRINITY_DN2296_c1_g6_i1.p1  ORF type:complete len:363 (+),score=98.07 TRINITY_DN2296_c1_g6_i1:37-1089(+)
MWMCMLMMVCCLAVVVAQSTCPVAPAVPGDRRKDKERLVLATYNVEWLFDGVNDKLAPWDGEAGAMAHLRNVARDMDVIGADVFVLQEVEDCTVLETLRKALIDGSQYRGYLVQGTETATGQDVALLSKIDPIIDLYRTSARAPYPNPSGSCRQVKTPDDTGVSKHFITKLRLTENVTIGLVGLHLIAWPTDKTRCAKREAQAAVISSAVKGIKGVQGTVVLGDYNDYSSSVPDARGDVPTSRVVDIIKSSTTPALIEAGSFMPRSRRVSHRYGSLTSMIDHCLLSPSLVPYLRTVSTLTELSASDHYPLVMTFNFSSASAPEAAEQTLSPTTWWAIAFAVVLIIIGTRL